MFPEINIKNTDKIYLIKNGEFEDIIPEKLIKKTINDVYKNEFNVAIADIRADMPMCKILREIMRTHGVGDFKKAEFANDVKNVLTLKNKNFVSAEVMHILEELKTC